MHDERLKACLLVMLSGSGFHLDVFLHFFNVCTKYNYFDSTLLHVHKIYSCQQVFIFYFQEIGYFHIRHSMKADRLFNIIQYAIGYLSDVNITVKAVVLDQETTQQMVMKRFFNVSPDEPWLHVDDACEKIYVVWDAPHLIKNVRNNLKRYNLKVC